MITTVPPAFPTDTPVEPPTNTPVPASQPPRPVRFEFLRKWGTEGSGDGQFNSLRGVARDGAGNVYVADGFNDRVQVFDATGRFRRKWGTEGRGDGQFDNPSGIAVDRAGDVYVADAANNRVQVFAPVR